MGFLVLRAYWTNRTYRVAVVMALVSGFTGLLQFALMGHFLQSGNEFPGIDQYGGNILAFLLTGAVFTGFIAVSLSGFSSFLNEEQQTGTLESLLVSTTSLTRMMLANGVTGLLGTTLGSAVMVCALSFMFGVPLEINFLAAAAVLAGLMLSLGGLGLAGCGVLLITKKGDPVTWTVTTVTALVSGVMYPVSVLPVWVQQVSQVLPMTQALHGLRMALTSGGSLSGLTGPLLNLAAWSLVTVPVGLLALRAGLRKARREGSLGEF
jgi:ABC-2 type transport system permease protein